MGSEWRFVGNRRDAHITMALAGVLFDFVCTLTPFVDCVFSMSGIAMRLAGLPRQAQHLMRRLSHSTETSTASISTTSVSDHVSSWSQRFRSASSLTHFTSNRFAGELCMLYMYCVCMCVCVCICVCVRVCVWCGVRAWKCAHITFVGEQYILY